MEEMIKLCFIIGMICLLLWGGFLALTTGANILGNFYTIYINQYI